MRATIITTVNHNVGDDFVREGILYLLERVLGPLEVSLIHKHIPVTVRPELEWIYTSGLTRFLDRLPKIKGLQLSKIADILPQNRSSDKIINCELLVQSGAPVYWVSPTGGGAYENEWYQPLIRQRYLKVHDQVPFINLGAGTCQPYYSDGSEFASNPSCVNYIRELHGLCVVTTVRDTLSKRVLNSLSLDAPVIPCPSIFARDQLGIKAREPKYIVLNYMPTGGHFGMNQELDSGKWEKTFADFYHKLSETEDIILVCHNERERSATNKILPGAKIFSATTAAEYLQFYAGAQFYIGNRVHGAFATASFGRPAFIVGSDTRARMADELLLKSVFVNEASLDVLTKAYIDLKARARTYESEFRGIKDRAFESYTEALSSLTPILQGRYQNKNIANPKVASNAPHPQT